MVLILPVLVEILVWLVLILLVLPVIASSLAVTLPAKVTASALILVISPSLVVTLRSSAIISALFLSITSLLRRLPSLFSWISLNSW